MRTAAQVLALVCACALACVAAAAVAATALDANAPLSATASAAPATTRAPGEPEPQWVEIPKDQPVPMGSHVRLDISTGQRWVNVAALSASGLPLYDPSTHDHDLEHKAVSGAVGEPVTARRASAAVVTNGPGAQPNDTNADADADGEHPLPAAGGAALLARHSRSHQAKVAGAAKLLTELDQKDVQPHGDAEVDPHDGPGPRVNSAGLDDLLLRGLYRQQTLDDDFSAMRAKLGVALSPRSTQAQVEAALEELEDLLHDRTNAIEFSSPVSAAKAGPMLGLRLMLQLLHRNELVHNAVLLAKEAGAPAHAASTSAAVNALRVQARAAWVVGTATQNNDKAQGFALADGAVHALLSALDAANQALGSVDVALHQPAVELQLKTLYALGSLLRASAAAKQQFHAQAGADVVLALIESALPATPAPAVAGEPAVLERLRPEVARKAIAIIRDVLSDHQFDPTFSFAPLVTAFKAPRYCAALSGAVAAPAATNAVREQLLHVMHLLLHANGCRAAFSARTLTDTVDRFAHEWDAAHHTRQDAAAAEASAGTGSAAHDHSAPDPTLHDHTGEESYELELYHVAQAFLHAARNPTEAHDAYDIAIGQLPSPPATDAAPAATAAAAAAAVAAAPALVQTGASVTAKPSGAAAAARVPPTAGDAHRPETDFEADEDDYVHTGSAEEHTGEHTAGDDDDSDSVEDDSEDDDDDEEDENPFLARRYRPKRSAAGTGGGYDPDADADTDADVAARELGAAGSDDDVDGDPDATIDEDDDAPAPAASAARAAGPSGAGRSKPPSSQAV